MKGLGLGCSPVPSPAVLRFLRIQADSLSFLASQKKACWTQTRLCHSASIKNIASCNERVGNTLGQGLSTKTKMGASYQSTLPLACRSTRNDSVNTCFSPGHRNFTTSPTTRKSFRPWHRIRQKPAGPLQPNDIPPASSFLDDNASLSRIVKPINELQLRCTEFDENGNVTLVNGAFKKSELIAKVCCLSHFREASLGSLTSYQSMAFFREICERLILPPFHISSSAHLLSSSTCCIFAA